MAGRAVLRRVWINNDISGVGVKFIKVGLAILVVALLAFIGGGYLLPKTAQVERSTMIESDPATIFEYVNNLEKFHSWSPWADMDPGMQLEFSTPASGVGARMSWSSQVPQVGNGVQTIVISEPDQRVVARLEYSGQAGGEAEIELVPVGRETKVIWRFRADFSANPLARYFGLVLDDMLGDHYAKGLEKLEHLVESQPNIVTEEIHYSVGETQLNGYLAYPRNATKAPGVLVVHEWWGHNEYVRKRANMLAELGYVAFALDMYGDGKVTGHPKEANAFMMEVVNNAEAARARFEKALDLLKSSPVVDEDKIAAIGYCFGGAVVLSMARQGIDLDGVVSYHGALEGLAPINADEVKARFIVFNGEADPFVTEEAKQNFKTEMDAAGLAYEFIDYPGAMHTFTNPEADEKAAAYGLPLKYDAVADQDSWQKTQEFFRAIF
jgi:dienelactone hydrolase/carbon monoxide dehydrogenase subunit G